MKQPQHFAPTGHQQKPYGMMPISIDCPLLLLANLTHHRLKDAEDTQHVLQLHLLQRSLPEPKKIRCPESFFTQHTGPQPCTPIMATSCHIIYEESHNTIQQHAEAQEKQSAKATGATPQWCKDTP